MLSYWIHSWTTMFLASSSCHQEAILEEEISAGRNFCKLVFDYQNFCLTKIFRYTVVCVATSYVKTAIKQAA